MKKVQVLGPGCPKCQQLLANAKEAVAALDGNFEVVKVDELKEIMSFGVMITPALAVDGEVRSTGKVLSSEEIRALLS